MALFRTRPQPPPAVDIDGSTAVQLLEVELAALRAELHERSLVSDAANERYELMVAAAGIGLWDMDVVADDPVNPDNVFQWSQEFRTMLGYQDERDFPNILSSWASRLHPDDAQRTVDAFLGHLNDRTGRIPYDIEYRLQLKNGTYRWFVATGATSRTPAGVPLRVAGALRDIDDQKQLGVTAERLLSQLTGSSAPLGDVSSDLCAGAADVCGGGSLALSSDQHRPPVAEA